MNYKILPFKFERFNEKELFLSNEVGEFYFISDEEFREFINHKFSHMSKTFLDLKAKQMVADTEIDPLVEMLATKYRTKKSFLNDFTSLHMVVPTLRCNSNCVYCQVSRKEENLKSFTRCK